MRAAVAATALAAVVLASALQDAAAPAAAHMPAAETSAARAAQPLCGSRQRAAAIRHVVWIVMENHSADQIIGPPGSHVARQMPYLNRVAQACGLAADYHAVTHPSLPNYIALTSGGRQGISRNCRGCDVRAPSLFGRLQRSGRTWRSYQESMPRPCAQRDSGLYVKRHNPAAYYPGLRRACRRFDIALGLPERGPLHRALRRRALPSFSFITPNLCHGMHDCPPSSADVWLERWIPRLTASVGYRHGRTAIFFLTEEGGHHGVRGRGCITSSHPSCIVPLVVLSASTRPGTVSRRKFSHYSLLRTTQRLLGAGPLLGHAADASTRSLVRSFNLG